MSIAPNATPALQQALGLTRAQARVYMAALELGSATMQDLARVSGVKRTSIYNFIGALKERHLIMETQKGRRRLYSAAHPEQLLEIKRVRMLQLEQLMPQLEAVYSRSRHRPRVTFYDGLDGIKQVYADSLRVGKDIVAWSDLDNMHAALGDDFDRYPSQRADSGIHLRCIARDSQLAQEDAKRDPEFLRETKFIPSGDLDTEVNIYGNTVALMNFRSRPPFAVLIKDAGIAQTLRTAWEALWERL